MAYHSFRENDMRKERILSQYLDEKLYSQNIFENVKRTNSTLDQFAGSDVVLSIPGKNLRNIIIDEKAQLYYLDGGLPTFAFELNFKTKSGNRVEGWLTDTSKKTTHYLLLFLLAKNGFNDANDIKRVEYILIEREKILNDINLNLIQLRQLGVEIAKSSEFYQRKEPNCKYYFTHSTQLAESPVNIILRKSALKEKCELHGYLY